MLVDSVAEAKIENGFRKKCGLTGMFKMGKLITNNAMFSEINYQLLNFLVARSLLSLMTQELMLIPS